MSTAELATSYAALILADDGVEITVSLRPMHMIFGWQDLGGFGDWGHLQARHVHTVIARHALNDRDK